MRIRHSVYGFALALAALALGATAPAHAQGKARHHAVSSDKAMDATRVVLQRQGYDLVKVVRAEDTQVIYYRRGNSGRGKGKGPMERMVIRTVNNRRVVFEDVPSAIQVDIDFELKL